MNKIFLAIVSFVFICFITANAQLYKKTELGIKTKVNSSEIEIQFFNASTVRIVKLPEGKTFDKKSLSVIETPQKTDFSIKQAGDELLLKSENIQVDMNLKSGKISFSTSSNEPLLSEKEEGVGFTDFDDAGAKTYSVYQSFVLDKDEAIYGLGQQQHGKMVQRNLKLHMIQGNTDDYIPFFVSVKGYGLFWDNYSPTLFEDNPESTSFKSDVGDCIDYYFMYGGNADGVIAQMRSLTGQVPMFPLWTFGYFQSKERYKGQDELIDVVKK
jgi:alpha-D-xyloside xylohydrolase